MNADLDSAGRDLDRLTALAGAFSGSAQGDLVVSAVAELRRALDAAERVRLPLILHASTGILSPDVVSRLTAEHPGGAITIVQSDRAATAVRRGDAAAGVLRLPAATRGLKIAPLSTEPYVVVVAATDPFADRHSVSVDELADRHLLH